MKFAFHCRVTVEGVVTVEAATEQDAWKIVLDNDVDKLETTEALTAVRLPIYRRLPSKDDFGL